MKKTIILSLALLMASVTMKARQAIQETKITDVQVARVDGRLSVAFSAEIGRRAVRGSETLLVIPELTDGINSQSLPAIVVQGSRARIATLRSDWVRGKSAQSELYDNAVFTKRGNTVHYSHSLVWQPWMDGAKIVAQGLNMGCCSYELYAAMPLVGNVQQLLARADAAAAEEAALLAKIAETEKATKAAEAARQAALAQQQGSKPATTGEKLQQENSFVEPYTGARVMDAKQMFATRGGYSVIYFRAGSSSIDLSMNNNMASMANMVASIKALQKSADSQVGRVVIAGFSSPDGSFALNDKLAVNRAVAVENYLISKTGLPIESIVLYNGSEDWDGLRMMVEGSDMPGRDKVLNIIDTVPVVDPVTKRERDAVLRSLDGGRPYSYMYQHFFPVLRNVTYIKLLFENK